MVNLEKIVVSCNNLKIIPSTINKLTNLKTFRLFNNDLVFLPFEILEIKDALFIDYSSYDVLNIQENVDFLIFYDINGDLTNLPLNLKNIWIKDNKDNKDNHIKIKLPFGCTINYY